MLSIESLSVVCLLFTGSEDDPWITKARRKNPEINFKNELELSDDLWLVMETMLIVEECSMGELIGEFSDLLRFCSILAALLDVKKWPDLFTFIATDF